MRLARGAQRWVRVERPYIPRTPTTGALYDVVRGNLSRFLATVDAAFAVAPPRGGAIAASIAAYRTLLSWSSNFWETRWLEHQIKQLGAGLPPDHAG